MLKNLTKLLAGLFTSRFLSDEARAWCQCLKIQMQDNGRSYVSRGKIEKI
jgi:hypothetical protein